jgi:hypothetical protein
MGTTTIDGQPVATATARAFLALAADFQKATGKSLHVTSGYRTYVQQKALYDAYRAGKGNLAANPDNPTAAQHMTGRALDVHDSGADAGVTVSGTARHKAMLSLLAKHGFKPTGDSFKPAEPWHIEYWGGDPYASAAAPAASSGAVLKVGSKGAEVGKLQAGLNRVFPVYSKLAVDDDFGAKTEAVVKEFQRRSGLTVDGIVGVNTRAALHKYGVL